MHNIKVLKAIADETRLDIILNLLRKEMSVMHLVDLVKKSQPNISIALRKLEEAGLIEKRKDGNRVIYSIKNKKFMEDLLALISDV